MQKTHSFLDPQLFRPEAIDPETRQFLDQLKSRYSPDQTPMYERQPADVRKASAQRAKESHSPNAQDRIIRGPGGNLSLRTFIPDTINGVYMYFHGGGFVIGRVDGQDDRLELLANDANVAVISVDYRLAPEYPYPAAHDDGEAAALWLVQNAAAEFGTDHLAIGVVISFDQKFDATKYRSNSTSLTAILA